MQPTVVDVGGVSFRFAPLPPVPAFKGVASLTKVLGKSFAGAGADGADVSELLVQALTQAVDELGTFYELLAPYTEASVELSPGTKSWMSLTGGGDVVFEGKPSLLFAATVKGVVVQYSDFLLGDGRELIVAMVSDLTSLAKSVGLSGD